MVILGQDPYHNYGQAHGLCFSVKKGVEIPPSLVNIYQELHDDLGCEIPDHGCLTKWAQQGVLMLNTVLTVSGPSGQFSWGIGWEEFTDAAIRALETDRPIVFILWGAPAQRKAAMLDNLNHLILKSPRTIPVPCLRTGDSSAAGLSVRPISFWRLTGRRLSTGRSGRAVKIITKMLILPCFYAKWLKSTKPFGIITTWSMFAG